MTERTAETNMPAAIKTQNDARAGAIAELVALARARRASSIAAFLASPDAALMAAAACWAACIGSVYGRACKKVACNAAAGAVTPATA